jgi:protein-disulfide isomerase
MRFLWAVLLAALLSPPVHAARDWTKTVSQTPAGAYVMGNPAAKVKLVEYLSLTCSHCAHFAQEGWPPLKANYIGKGLVSLEVRHAVRDGFDLTGSMLARCSGPKGYFAASEAILTGLPSWGPRASEFAEKAWPRAGRQADRRAHAGDRQRIGPRRSGRRARPALGRVKACLLNAPEQKKLAAMAKEAWAERNIGGTPAFMINGELQPGMSSWEALEPKLQAVLKGL